MNNNADKLTQARQKDSRVKRERALLAVDRLARAGMRITVARVAREANVSTWLLYNAPDIKEAIELAASKQATARATAPPPEPGAASHSSLRTDLALARHQIAVLRTERDALKRKVERVLDQEIHARDHQQVLERLDELELMVRDRDNKLEESNRAHDSVARERDTLAEELATARLLNQAFIRQQNAAMDPPVDRALGVGIGVGDPDV